MCSYLHELLFGALWANDVLSVGDEALADQRRLALRADEAVVMPVTVLERDEASAADACDRLGARGAALREQLPEALGAVRLLVPRGEPLSGERGVAVGAREALAMPRLVLVRHTALSDYLVTLDATSGKLVFIAPSAVDLLFTRDKALCADRVLTHDATEALLVPLSCLVLHLLGSSAEHLSTSITPAGELRIVAVAAVDLIQFGAKLLVHQ